MSMLDLFEGSEQLSPSAMIACYTMSMLSYVKMAVFTLDIPKT
jgi:hypothetical protein